MATAGGHTQSTDSEERLLATGKQTSTRAMNISTSSAILRKANVIGEETRSSKSK